MKVDLEVIASAAIKAKHSKRPWPHITWIGEEQESLLLLDTVSKRISVLYVPSGKTKKSLSKVSTLAKQTKCYARTRNGRYLLGLLENGELFIWHKDKDVIKIVAGLDKVADSFQNEDCHINAADDCNYILVAIGSGHFLLWVMEKGADILRPGDPALKGTWHTINIPPELDLPSAESREWSVSSVFYDSPTLGECGQCSVVFNKDTSLVISTVLLQFPHLDHSFVKSVSKFTAKWSMLVYPFQQMHAEFEAVSTPGAYVSAYGSNGQVLAVAANQRSPFKTTMLFVSPLTETVLVSSMKSCGTRDPNKVGRHYWVSDLSWTCDGLFVTCMLKNGSVCLIPRLGDPVPIQTRGESVDMGPALYLPLHPAVFVSDEQGNLEPTALEKDPNQQQFSLATHPSLPIMLFSDGFLVTVAQFPAEMTSASVMRDLVLESARHLKGLYQQQDLDMTVADAYRLSKGQRGSKQNLAGGSKSKGKKAYQFEMAEVSLNASADSDTSLVETAQKFGFDQFGAIGNMDAGKIVFGEPEMIAIDPNATFSHLEASEALLKYLEESMASLMQVWKLAVSYPDIWTKEVDNITKQAVHNFIKIFTVVLDCEAVDSIMPILTPRQSSQIQNPRVYNVIVAFRNILQLLRFDKYSQHLITAALRLVHKTISLMLASKGLAETDPMIKTLFGCFSLLKHADGSLNRIYEWVPSDSQTGTPTSDHSPRRLESSLTGKPGTQSTGSGSDGRFQLPGKRLASTWKVLYQATRDYQSAVVRAGDSQGEAAHMEKLLVSIQQILLDSDAQVTPRTAAKKLSAGEKLSVDGDHSLAMDAWKQQLKVLAAKNVDNTKTAKTLHSILYTYLETDELGKAVEYVDSLIFQARVHAGLSSQELPAYDDLARPPLMTLVTHRSQDSEEEELVPCIKNKSIRQTVQTMARFMAAYFSNQSMFIYPPASPKLLPCVHVTPAHEKSRVIPKYHEKITSMVTQENLSTVWTTERTVEYLLLSGLICETAWFAHKMGDWKTAFLLSVAHTSHMEIAPQLYRKSKKPMMLPANLYPHAILQEKLLVLIQSNKADSAPGTHGHTSRYFIPINQETNIATLNRTLEDVLTAGIVSGVELVPWLLGNLVGKLHAVVSNLSPLVPEEFYLPAPPLFCPQPGEVEMSRDHPEVQYEREVRMEISSIIQLLLVALNSAHVALPAARWYIQELFKMQEKAAQFKATTEGPCLELPQTLQQYKIVRSDLSELRDQPNVHEVLTSFRDFATLLWVLHVRDELSLHLRKRGSQLSADRQDGQESPESTLGQEYVQDCFKALKWAVHMLAFNQYIADDGRIRKSILSLILELPANEDTADILAEHFYDMENLDSDIRDKLERLVARWQSIEIVPEDDGKSARLDEGEEIRRSVDDDDDDDGSVRKSVTFFQASPRAKTLSVYFHKQCDVVQKVLRKKRKFFGQYEEFVFVPDFTAENSQSGTYGDGAICIGSRPFETKQSYLEFLDRYYAICFTKVVEKESEAGNRQKQPILMPFDKVIREVEFENFLSKYEESYQKKHSSVVMASPRAKFFRSQSESQGIDSPSTPQRRSLYRSNSSGVVEQPAHPSSMARYESEGSLYSKGRQPGSPSRAKPNMTQMASRFFQSEEALYRGPGESQEVHWILDVNFGQRYLALQHLLDYLYHWAGKQHSLGLHGKSEKEIGLKPKMRIEVPTQLVVLGLWLVENKYSDPKLRPQQVTTEQELNIPVQAVAEEATPRTRAKQKSLATVEELTEHDSFTQVSNMPRSRSHSPRARRSRSHSPQVEISRSQSAGFNVPSTQRTLDYIRSINTTQEETEQMHTEYKRILDGGDDSSSLEVSSLDADDDQNASRQSTGSGRPGRSRKPHTRRRSPQRVVDSSPETRNNSAFNHTLQFESSPERHSAHLPSTSTPLQGNSPSRRQTGRHGQPGSADVSRISQTLPPTGQQQQAPPFRSSMPAASQDPLIAPQMMAPLQSVPGVDNPGNMAGLDIAQQLQMIVRGELRRMMQVQHQSMMAMMGALDGQPVQAPPQPINAWQPTIPANQIEPEEQGRLTKGKQPVMNVLGELKNLQVTEEKQQKRRRSKSSDGKENVGDETMRMSELRNGENIEVYRISQDGPGGVNFYPNFLRIPAEKDTNRDVKFPQIPREAWESHSPFSPNKGVAGLPLLHVDRTVPAHKFPVSERSHSLPPYKPEPGFFRPPSGVTGYPPAPKQTPQSHEAQKTGDSQDSGIEIPLLRLQFSEEGGKRRQPRFGELLPPDQVIESAQEANQKEQLRERYLREYHQLQAEKATEDFKRGFGQQLLKLNLQELEEERARSSRKSPTPRKTPRKSPRKTPRSVSEQVSKASIKSKKKLDWKEDPEDEEQSDQQPISEKHSKSQPISERRSKSQPIRSEGAESDEEDATEAESIQDEEQETGEGSESEEEPLHDGYAMKHGEFEAYLALEHALTKTRDTNARIQLKTALRLQRQRMMENWKRPKVDFATNTAEELDAGTDPVDFPPEPVRYSEKATSITKDTGVDPIQEAVIEYNQSRQAHVLPPDIYMGLRFAETEQPGSDVTGQAQDSRGRNYLNVVDLDASAVLADLRERPEPSEPQLDTSLTPEQLRMKHRIAQEEISRVSFEAPVIERPTRADELTVKMFETKFQGHDRVSLAVMPRDSMPESKYAIMQRLRDMNSQLSAIDQMSNNIEREFKSTRLAIGALEDMTAAMEPAPKHATSDDQDYDVHEKRPGSRASSRSEGRTLTPQPSAKSPTPSVRATARSTARTHKSTLSTQDKKEMSAELAKVSGLSGISDIIGDMVAQGHIDLDDVGLSQREADRLVQRGIIRREEQHEAAVSLEEIKRLADTAQRDGAKNREDLRHWMAQKRHQQMKMYKHHMDELRERERRPFRPASDTINQSRTYKEKKTLSETREESRKASKKAFMTQRMDDAQHLLGNILSEKPELPPELPARVVTPRRKTGKDRSPVSVRDRSPVVKQKAVRDTSAARKPQGILKSRDTSPSYYQSEYDPAMEGYDSYDLELDQDWLLSEQQQRSQPFQSPAQPMRAQPRSDTSPVAPSRQVMAGMSPVKPAQHVPTPSRAPVTPARRIEVSPVRDAGKKAVGVVPKLKLSLGDVEEEEPQRLMQTGETTGDLAEYYKAIKAMETTGSQDHSRDILRHQSIDESEDGRRSPVPQKTFKVKPYTEIVKVQRPEVTRKKANKFGAAIARRHNSMSQADTSRTSARTEVSEREREMIYGSKRMPVKKPTETTPRRVKTYTERLQEMKGKEKFSTPVVPRSHYASSVASTSARPASRPVGPRHKPMTYVEQLQKMNAPHHKLKGSGTTVIQKPVMRSHKPLHKPKTYAQQLQELQPGKTFVAGPPSKRGPRPAGARQRPYRDPYASVAPDDLDQLEAASVISGWSMSDDVKHILYDDAESSIAVGQSASYAPSEQISDYYMDVMGEDYTASVDIDDLVKIADAGSVSSGSMASYIDWDQVDELIADVRY